jgi:hypothetical protein
MTKIAGSISQRHGSADPDPDPDPDPHQYIMDPEHWQGHLRIRNTIVSWCCLCGDGCVALTVQHGEQAG